MSENFPFTAQQLLKNKRALVIECSVAVEQMVSNQVCLMMDIDRKSSKLFGIGSSSLSFNQKVEFLVELDYYDKTQKEKLNRFAEIRNKFAHLAEVTTFEQCFELLTGLVSKLQKWYPDIAAKENIAEDDRYMLYFHSLFLDLEREVDRFVKHYNDRLHQRIELEVKADRLDALLDTIALISQKTESKAVDEFITHFFEKSESLYQVLDQKREDAKKVDHKIKP